jgi:sodium-coupled neutral amino acid transporter 7/8
LKSKCLNNSITITLKEIIIARPPQTTTTMTNSQPLQTPLLNKLLMTPYPSRPTDQTYNRGSGTLTTSIFTLANSAIGSGILAFPFAFMKAGLGGGLIITLIFAMVMGASLHFITACVAATQLVDPRIRSYEELAAFVGGTKLRTLLEITLLVYLVGCCIGFLIIVGDMATPILSPLLLHAFQFDTDQSRQCIIVGVSLIIILPLCLLKKISALSFSSAFAVCAVTYMVGTIGYEYVSRSDSISNTTHATPHQHDVSFVWFQTNVDVLAALPLLAFALQCHIQVPLIYTELRAEERTVARMDLVCAGAYALCLVLYLPAGALGYLTFGNNTPTDILKGYPLDDTVADTARGCIAIVACCGFPLNHFPARSALWGIWTRWTKQQKKVGENSTGVSHSAIDLAAEQVAVEGQAGETEVAGGNHRSMSMTWRGAEAILWVIITMVVALHVTDLGVVFGLIGAIGGSLVIFFIPSYLWYTVGPNRGHWTHLGGVIVAVSVGLLVLVMGTLTTLKVV